MLSQCKMQKVCIHRQADFEKWTKILSKFQKPKDPMENRANKHVLDHNGHKMQIRFSSFTA